MKAVVGKMSDMTAQSVPEAQCVAELAGQAEQAGLQREMLQELVGGQAVSSGTPSRCDQECHTNNMSQASSGEQEVEKTP